MKNILIYDMAYAQAADRKNIIDLDVMQTASYYKQKGDLPFLWQSDRDWHFHYDAVHIFSYKDKTTQIPKEIFYIPEIRWGLEYFGADNRIVCGCRPDYLFYPNKNTRFEKGVFWRFLDADNRELKLMQMPKNTFVNNLNIIADLNLWDADITVIARVLHECADLSKVSLLGPIDLYKLMVPEVLSAFLKLQLANDAHLTFKPIQDIEADTLLRVLIQIRAEKPRVSLEPVPIIKTGKIIYDVINQARNHRLSTKIANPVEMKDILITKWLEGDYSKDPLLKWLYNYSHLNLSIEQFLYKIEK